MEYARTTLSFAGAIMVAMGDWKHQQAPSNPSAPEVPTAVLCKLMELQPAGDATFMAKPRLGRSLRACGKWRPGPHTVPARPCLAVCLKFDIEAGVLQHVDTAMPASSALLMPAVVRPTVVTLDLSRSFLTAPRNLAGNPDSPQAVIFLMSITDVMMGS